MRLSLVMGCALVLVACVTLGGIVACGGDDDSTPPNSVADGGTTVTEDGAVVGTDGNVVEPPTDSSTPKPSKVIATNESVSVMGAARTYVLAVPKSYDAARSYPLIVAMHGDGQNGPGFRAFLDFDDLAGDDAVVVYPSNAEDLFTPYAGNTDQQMIEAIIGEVKGKLTIDASKVWAFGYSKGGFMANQIACRKPGLFKALAVHASGAPQDVDVTGYPSCPGVIGLPVLATEGDNDQGIGGAFAAMYWSATNGCTSQKSATTPAACQTYNGCPADKSVTYCMAPKVNHYPIWADADDVSWAWFKTL